MFIQINLILYKYKNILCKYLKENKQPNIFTTNQRISLN